MKNFTLFILAILLFFPNTNREPNERKIASLFKPIFSKVIFENTNWYTRQKILTKTSGPTLLGTRQNTIIDVRGVGDSALLNTQGLEAKNIFSSADPLRDIFIGDISFINWESVIGMTCLEKRTSVDFYFLSHPQAIKAAVEHGFNVFGLSNNHSQDCNKGKAFEQSNIKRGPLMSFESMEKLYPKGSSILWHGVGPKRTEISEENILINGKNIKVAFMSLSIVGWDIPDAATINFSNKSHSQVMSEAENYLQSFDQSDATIKILSLHTQDATGNNKNEDRAFLFLKEVSELFIDKYEGKIVFGQGPHTKGGIKVFLNREQKPHAVIFTSLGNFIHQGLAVHGDNYLGRVLFDFNSSDLTIKEIQAIPLKNEKTKVSYYNSKSLRSPDEVIKQTQFSSTPSAPYSNFEWTKGDLIDEKNNKAPIAGYYAVFK